MDSSGVECPRILACDVGLKRIGLAHIVRGVVLPLRPIIRRNRNQAAADLSILLEQRGVENLIVGMPSGGVGGDTSMQERIRYFVALLAYSGEVTYIDEDYTSISALESLHHVRRKSKQIYAKNGVVDSLAACEILKRYLADRV